MEVDVSVGLAVMLVLMGVDLDLQGLAQAPESDGDKQHADEAFASG